MSDQPAAVDVSFTLMMKEVRLWRKKVDKGAWRMPWLMEAMKDVISCENLRVGANNL